MYSKPELKRFGSFRDLTLKCWWPFHDHGDDDGGWSGSKGGYGRTGS